MENKWIYTAKNKINFNWDPEGACSYKIIRASDAFKFFSIVIVVAEL